MSKLRSSREQRQNLVIDNQYLENSVEGMRLVASLISMPNIKEEVAGLLEQLNKLIHYDFLTICNMESTPNEAELVGKLKKAFDDLEDLTEFSALANKNIVAIGGGFSAGKSRFLNSILKDDLLPTDTTPTTAIPTYIAWGAVENIHAINTFNLKVPVDREAVKAISHAFHQKYNVSFSHIIKTLTVENPDIEYSNIAFLDTPGYSKSESLVKGDNTDERIAREHLSNADYLIWLVDASKGTIPETDLKFLKELQFNKPMFVVFNKADLRQPSEVAEILEIAKERLMNANLKYAGIAAYNSAIRENNVLFGNSIHHFLETINRKQKFATVQQQFESVFQPFLEFNHDQYANYRSELEIYNEMYLYSDQLPNERKVMIKQRVDALKRQVQHQKQIVHSFQILQKKMIDLITDILALVSVVDQKQVQNGISGIMSFRKRDEILNISEGMEVAFTVKQINPFGVFLDGGYSDEGLLSIDEIKQAISNDIKDVFFINKKLVGKIKEIDRIKKIVKFSVSLT